MLLLILMLFSPETDFERPESEYGSGHRGIDLKLDEVSSPVDGEVSFVGKVFTRELITIESRHGKFSFEPVCSELSKGDLVSAGQIIGTRCVESDYSEHCEGCVHISFRDPEYRNPLWVLGLREPSRPVSGPRMGLFVTFSEPFD